MPHVDAAMPKRAGRRSSLGGLVSSLLLAVVFVMLPGSADAQTRVFEPPCVALLPASALLRTAVSRGCGTVCVSAVVMWLAGRVSLQRMPCR